MKIAICTLHVGDKFKEETKYGKIVKEQYCKKHDYDYIDDETVVDHSRDFPWSKIKVIQKHLPNYDYVVWIDADIQIMNSNKKLDEFIDEFMGNNLLMYVKSRQWVNTGVMFIKNDPFMFEFFDESYKHTNQICWEQGAIDFLYRINWKGCQSKIHLVNHKLFNSDWFDWDSNDFIVHFPGCSVQKSPGCLRKMMELFCPIKMDHETVEQFNQRYFWLYNFASAEMRQCKRMCDTKRLYFPFQLYEDYQCSSLGKSSSSLS